MIKKKTGSSNALEGILDQLGDFKDIKNFEQGVQKSPDIVFEVIQNLNNSNKIRSSTSNILIFAAENQEM